MKVQVVRGGSLGPGAGQTGKDSLWGAGEDTGVGASGWPGSQTGVGCGGRTRLTEPWGVSPPLLDPCLPFWSRWLDLGRASKRSRGRDRDVGGCT